MTVGGGARPDFVAGTNNTAINFNPYVEFNRNGSTGEYIRKNGFIGFDTKLVSSFTVLRRNNSNDPSDDVFFHYSGSGGGGNAWAQHRLGNIRITVDGTLGGGRNSSFNAANSIPHIFTNIRGNGGGGVNDDNIMRLDATQSADNNAYEKDYTMISGSSFLLGQDQDGSGSPDGSDYQGDIAETIVFNKRVTNNERDIVESYLGVKYGITLNQNYYLSNHTISWNQTTNSAYHRNVTGIGRDDDMQLDQRKSRSQNPSNVDVTIEHSTAFSTNRSHLVWGCNNGTYDNVGLTNAPSGVRVSEKIWKVQNNSNNVGTVTVMMDIPPSLSGQNPSEIKLLVGSNSNFAFGYTSYTGTAGSGIITYTGVSLQNADFFTLAVAENVSFVNNDAGSPGTFEACPGSNVTFYYSNLNSEPNAVMLTDTAGTQFSVSVPATNTTGGPNPPYGGELTFNIPSNTGTGNVILMDGGNVVYDIGQNFVVHNPELTILPQTSPVCASDTVALIGIPAGGSFSCPAVLAFVNNDSIVGSEAGWANINQVSKSIDVVYTYTPTYINGTPCLSSVNTSESVIVKDNRLDELTFKYIITATENPNVTDQRLLDLTPANILSISPDSIQFSFPVKFLGTYVEETTPGVYTFLTDQSGFGSFPITVQYDNGGCIGEITSDMNVFPPLRLPGLEDTLCREASPVVFTRDPLPEYAYKDTTTSVNYGNITVTKHTTSNEITSVVTQNSAYQPAIGTISTTFNAESYSFDPNVPALNPTSMVVVEMYYTTTIQTTLEYWSVSPYPYVHTYTNSYDIIGFDTVYLEDRPVPQILNFDTYYCATAEKDTIRPIPAFDNPTYTYFKFWGHDGFSYNLLDTLVNDTIFDFAYHYAKHIPLNDRHLDVQLVYTVDRYGCFDTDTAYTRIIAPVQAIILNNNPYCESDLPSTINVGYGGLPPTGGSGVFFSAPGLDTTNTGFAIFSPGSALAGSYPIEFLYTDFFGCKSTGYDTLFVKEPPLISMAAGAFGDNSFCANDSNVLLQTVLLPTNIPLTTSVTYNGPSISGNIFNPATVFGAGGGATDIYSEYVDTFGCKGYDTLAIQIHGIPVVAIDSFNGNDNITLGRSQIFDHKYCQNDSSFIIGGTPLHLTGQGGVITGGGVVLKDSTYYYDPTSLSTNQPFVDLITYTYTDTNGCTNFTNTLIMVDSIPEVTISGIDSSYCVNSIPDSIIGFPDFATYGGFPSYGGPGVNPTSGVFSPFSAGTGDKVLNYSYQDSRGCRSTIYKDIKVHSLPTPLFGSYKNQYCTTGIRDTLISNNVPTTGSSFSFSGNVIVDPLGVLDPGNDTSGTQTIYYTFTDSLGCSNTDSVNVFVHPTPEITITGLDSAYCFNAPEDNISAFPPGRLENNSPGFTGSGNTIIFDPDQDTAGVKVFTYIHSDPVTGCADTISLRTYVHKPITPEYSGLNTFYCETPDTFLLTGLATGGIFTGPGIISDTTYRFSPAKAGPGFHDIMYQAKDTFIYTQTIPSTTLICTVDTIGLVEVRALPVPTIQSPGNNFRFCSTDTSTLLVSGTINSVFDTFATLQNGIELQIDTLLDTITLAGITYYVFAFDTSYYFNPLIAATGTNIVTYIAQNNYGCIDSVHYTYLVDGFSAPQFAVDSVYCESEASIVLFGVPTGGSFIRDGDTLQPSLFIPNPNYPTASIISPTIDTLIYAVQDGACYGADTQYVRINPVPQLSFTGSVPYNIYCIGMDSIPLTPNTSGGVFTGNGVLFASTAFIPDLAGVGHHPVYYDYTDPLTGCSNQAIDTFSVYGMPNVSYSVIGGCQMDSVFFRPDNVILGLNNIFNNQVIDSITSITWKFEPSVTVQGSQQNNFIDTIGHIYTNPGVYFTSLYVTNQEYCTDTQEVRLVISPKVSGYPYDETFETSNGNWYAESRDSLHPLLWEWGADNNNNGISAGTNQFWATQLDSAFSINEDAWVYSPCFDISSLDRPMITFDHWSDSRFSADGTVLEYQNPTDGTWTPLGELGRGVNWYNSQIIIGQPGDQSLAPIGWSGESDQWINSRYKLDQFLGNTNLRLRFAFGSSSVDLSNFYDGFGFDNVWIGDRTRNVLLETSSNYYETDMMAINNYVYNLAYHSEINKDVVLLQYNIRTPNPSDEFHQDNQVVSNSMTYYYGVSDAGRSYIDGNTIGVPWSKYLTPLNFEVDMLKFPKFDIKIDTFYSNSQSAIIEATVTALEDMPEATYHINTLITEDSMNYMGTFDMVHAVVRKDDEDHVNEYFREWTVGESQQVIFSWDYANEIPTYDPEHFQAVVFIRNKTTREIFQTATSRDISGYLIIDNIESSETELAEINSMNLYPNPAGDYFNVDFAKELSTDYQWKLMDVRGVEYQTGTINTGEQRLTVDNYDFPAGVYILVVYNDHVFSQRKVIINKE